MWYFSINSSDEMFGCESLRLSHGRWISDGPPRFGHVTRVISNASNAISLDLDMTLWMRFRIVVGF